MKKFSSVEETRQLVELLKQKPEIDEKIKFYRGVLVATDTQIKAIETRVKRGYQTETFRFIGFPISKKILLDEYDIAKLEIEKLEAESKLFHQQQYFENWLSRSRDYEVKYAEITKDCEANYDTIFSEACAIKHLNPRLSQVMDAYDNKDNNLKTKTEYFLYLKQEVENSKQYGKKTFAQTQQ
jgi:hypothetical protein